MNVLFRGASAVAGWLDDRTGCKTFFADICYQRIPGGPRWRYIWGSLLAFAFFVQLATGIFLWMSYSPSSATAWASVNYISHEMTGGWFLRGVHHYMAQAMIVLLVLHMTQVVLTGAYRAPREVNFWLGLVLLQLVLILGLTGYLLPWDVRGYRATQIATTLASLVPVAGPYIQRIAVGGPEFGHHTLTRFFALHAGILPGLFIFFLILHIVVFRRHGYTVPESAKNQPAVNFWPDQALRNLVGCLILMLVVVGVTWHFHGAELGPPAQLGIDDASARPEWYFLFLFQTLKYFPGEKEIIGAHIIPGAVAFVLILFPFIGRWKLGHYFNIGFLFAVFAAVLTLSTIAITEDLNNPQHQLALKKIEQHSKLFTEMAREGIPHGGLAELAAKEPRWQGPKVFAQHCANCHRINGHDGTGHRPSEPATAFDLAGFGSREWIEDLLNPKHVESPLYFGSWQIKTKDETTGAATFETEQGEMLDYVKSTIGDLGPNDRQDVYAVAKALSAEAQLPYQAKAEAKDKAEIERGRQAIAGSALDCTSCHKFHDQGELGSAPDLTGYGSTEWLVEIIRDPAHERFYQARYEGAADAGGEISLMPAFGHGDLKLSDQDIQVLVAWLRTTRKEFIPEAHVAKDLAAQPTGDAAATGQPVAAVEEDELKPVAEGK